MSRSSEGGFNVYAGTHIGDNINRDKIVNTSASNDRNINIKLIDSEINRILSEDSIVTSGMPANEIPIFINALGKFQKSLQSQHDKPTLLSSLGVIFDCVSKFPNSLLYKTVRSWKKMLGGD